MAKNNKTATHRCYIRENPKFCDSPEMIILTYKGYLCWGEDKVGKKNLAYAEKLRKTPENSQFLGHEIYCSFFFGEF